VIERLQSNEDTDMSWLKKMLSIIKTGTKEASGLASVATHFAAGDEKGGVTELLELVEEASEGHPSVKATLVKVQNALAAHGLAEPVAVVAAEAEEPAASTAPEMPQPAQEPAATAKASI
jgi:hypothetical protein